MEEPTSARADPATVTVGRDDPVASAETALPTFARYDVLDRLGEGAMGVVYRARDTKLERGVALKVVRRAHVRWAGERRLLREAQAMAQVNHPNVVTVFDVRSDRGRVLLAMELVEGDNLAAWLRGRAHAWRDVLDVFVAAGRGLAAVHAVGLTHRDFKPANVLIARDGRVCVGDFGLTKVGSDSVDVSGPREPASVPASGSSYTSDPLTEVGIVMGTPAYMAPEQFAGEVTAASDQYAFCVALWEGLCGKRPFAGDYDELVVAKAKVPPWPSPAGVPARVGRALVRGLDPDPERRHRSVDDLLRALAPGRRRRTAFSALVLGGLVVAGVATFVATAREGERACDDVDGQVEALWGEHDREAIHQAFARAQAPDGRFAWVAGRLDALVGTWGDTYREVCTGPAVEAAAFDLRMDCLRQQAHAISATVTVLGEADRDVIGRAGSMLGSPDAITRCRSLEVGMAGTPAPPPEAVADEVASLDEAIARVEALYRGARYEEGIAAIEPLVDRAVATRYGPVVARAQLSRARLLRALGRFEDAVAQLAEASEVAVAADDLRRAADAASLRGYVLARDLQHNEEALRYAREGLALATRVDPGGSLEAMAYSHLASVESGAGEFAAAIEHYEIAMAIDERGGRPRDQRSTRAALGDVYAETGQLQKAETIFREVLAELDEEADADPSGRGHAFNNLGMVIARQARYEEARALFEQALQIRRELHGESHPTVGDSWVNVGTTLAAAGDYARAEPYHRRGLEILEATLGPDNPRVSLALNGLADDLSHLDREEEALVLFRRSHELRIKAYGPRDLRVVAGAVNLANTLTLVGRHEEADRRYAEALELARTVEGAQAYHLPVVLSSYATSLARRGDFERAESLLREAVESMTASPDTTDPARLAESREQLARVRAAQGDLEAARDLLQHALTFRAETFGPADDQTRETQRLLDEIRALEPGATLPYHSQ